MSTTVSTRITHALLVLVLLALLSVVAMLATSVRGGPLDPPGSPGSTDGVRLPGTPITGPTTITQSGYYYLTRNISVSGAVTAITVVSYNVTLDLGGFTIFGDDTAGSAGISLYAARDTKVHNGRIRDVNIAVNADFSTGIEIADVSLLGNYRGIVLGDRTLLRDCRVLYSAETGIYAPGNSSEIRNCQVGGATTGVHLAGSGNHLTDSSITASTGLLVTGNQNIVRDTSFPFATIRSVELSGDNNRLVDNVFECVAGQSVLVSGGTGNVLVATDHANVC